MTASVTELVPDADDIRIARLAAAAIALAVLEAGVPSPVPGIKPGLANIVTLYALVRHGWRVAAAVALLRIFGGAILLGGFLSPGFVLSLAGGIASLAALAPARLLPARWFGVLSLSLIAAFAHIAGQLLVARLWLIPHDGLKHLVPLFAAAAWGFGIVNGLIAAHLLEDSP
ncbi:Gx transporter family protein [Jeongeupia sp. USM3]|uniref:Gx transporter family protein n=1 Tax=Jeongeupia sp. USM3 TaxID=1906741 RepID=UPI00089DFD9A|nr:Gx transporter family protein [Jeongeupia sp. USM3]AOY01319.1 heptaprenyl diphosphate synthase [Jeongeupia sp. USM3]